MITDERVRALLEGRRWFAGDAANARIVEQAPLAVDPPMTHVLVESNGEIYQLVLDADENEIDDNVNEACVLLHEVAAGPADRSYGLAVARLAGLSLAVVGRAKDVLKRLEAAVARTGVPVSVQ